MNRNLSTRLNSKYSEKDLQELFFFSSHAWLRVPLSTLTELAAPLWSSILKHRSMTVLENIVAFEHLAFLGCIFLTKSCTVVGQHRKICFKGCHFC